MSNERVVLLEPDGSAAGTADKIEVHHADTPLHLAFSCHLFDDGGRTLLTRRALSKKTWPGAWTNTCCGHPAPGEPLVDAVHRRVRQELGVEIDDLRLLLPSFRYHAVMDDGTVENEMCPVFVGRLRGTVDPDPDEVEEYAWSPWSDLLEEVAGDRSTLSPWAVSQLRALPADPLGAEPRSESDLPPAARA
jgi:isopentenyl-diphosphate delta-isomerase